MNAYRGQLVQRGGWIAHTVHGRPQLKLADRPDEIRAQQLTAAVCAAPIPDPHELPLGRRRRKRLERPGVGSLVPCPGAAAPAAFDVAVADDVAEGEHAVIVF